MAGRIWRWWWWWGVGTGPAVIDGEENISEHIFRPTLELRMNFEILIPEWASFSKPGESGNTFECLTHLPGWFCML